MRAAPLLLALLAPLPTLAQGVGIGPVCDGTVALDSAMPSVAMPGEVLVVVRSLVSWPVRYRQAAPAPAAEPPAPPPAAPPPATARGGARGEALPPGLAFDLPPELLDRALTERLFPGAAAAGPAPSANFAPAAPPRETPRARWLLPGEAVTLRVAPGPGGLLQRLGLRCDGGTSPLAPPTPLR